MTRIRQAGKRMQTCLRGIANKARADKRHRFRNLYGLLNEEALLSSWPLVKKRAASGVDRVSAQQYAEDLEGNVGRLVERLKRKSYRARLVRFSDWIRAKRHRPIGWIFAMLNRKLLSYYNDYGVRGSSRSIEAFLHPVLRILFK